MVQITRYFGSEYLRPELKKAKHRIDAFARTGSFDTVEDDGEMLSETALYANAYARSATPTAAKPPR